jgi:hypothetical protein
LFFFSFSFHIISGEFAPHHNSTTSLKVEEFMNDLVPKQTIQKDTIIYNLSTLYWCYPYALGWLFTWTIWCSNFTLYGRYPYALGWLFTWTIWCSKFTLYGFQSILRQKNKNYENSNISSYKNINLLQKNPLKETKNPSRYHNNSIITNLKFQHKPKCHHLSKILI